MKIAFCTIASLNYLSRVQVLEKSVRAYHPDADFKVLLCEQPEICREAARDTGRTFYAPSDIGCADWLHMAFYYDITAYNTALKPFFLEKLLLEGYQAVFYFDPDIEIYGVMDKLLANIQTSDVIVTPHACKPVPEDGKSPDMASYIRAGQFNLGFLGISNSFESIELLRWWQSVLVEKCIYDQELRYFVDQFWAAAFPSFMEKTCILRDPAYNMAYWNVFQRKLDHVDGKWLTDSGELKFFHFSGLNRNDLTKVSNYQNRVTAPVGSPLYKLLEQYFGKISQKDLAKYNEHPYSFAKYSNGEPITGDERLTFLSMNRAEREAIGNPFDANSAPKNVIRIKCKTETPRTVDTYSRLAEINAALLNSLSWRITAPLRRLHIFLTRKKIL